MINGIPVFDVDCHYMEPPDLWNKYLPAELRSRGPVGSEDRGGLVVDGDRRWPTHRINMTGLNDEWQQRYEPFEDLDWGPAAYELAMETMGIDRMALWPSRGLMQVTPWGLDPVLAAAVVRAYNRWVADFSPSGANGVVRVGQLDLRDVHAAIDEAETCVRDFGFHGFFIIPETPLPGVTLERPYYDPLWSALEDLDVPLVIHNVAGTGLGSLAADRFGDWAVPRIAFAFPLETQVAAFQFILGGILERHPRLRVCFTESGVGWVPGWLYWLEEMFEEFQAKAKKGLELVSTLPTPLDLRPTEYFRRQCFVTFELEETKTLGYAADFLGGVENLVVSCDFPHPEGAYLDGIREFVDRRQFDDEQHRAILWDNPNRLFGLSVDGPTT